ncbi:MAG: SseB family protein [Lachnospiraceae bacterium]
MFGRKRKEENAENVTEENKTDKNTAGETEACERKSGFVLGVRGIYALPDSDDLMVIGKAEGTVKQGDAVFLSNLGEDDGYLFVSTVLGIEKAAREKVTEACDCQVALRVERASRYPVKPGTVVFSKDRTTKEVHPAYIAALGDAYVAGKNLELTEKELDRLSITDCAELWGLFVWYHTKVMQNESEETVRENKRKIGILAKAMSTKILAAETIYCIYSKATGEPYLFSKIIYRKDGSNLCMCTPPMIRILTKAYRDRMADKFPEDKFEIREIQNGTGRDGIRKFLGDCFYLNGACGLLAIGEQAAIAADMLVEKPDFSNVPEIRRPIMNPNLERWILLIGQLGQPETEDQKTIYRVYYRLLAQEMVKARLLVPTKVTGEIPEPDAEGKVVLKKGVTFSFPTVNGKNGRPAVRMYTDWKRLRNAMGDEWQGNIQTVEGMIGKFDCIINLSENIKTGCYVGEEMYRQMKVLAESGNEQPE